jgi:hypothetical protein
MVPFAPAGPTVNIDVSGSNQRVQINSAGGSQVRVCNLGTATAWINYGTDNTVAATIAAGMPIPGNGFTEIHTKATGPIWVAAIAVGSTGKIHFTPGSGL